MTELVTEMPRSFSSAIQSEVAWRAALRDFTLPAIWIAPPNSSSFSVSVVLPASGCEMIANVRRRWVWFKSVMIDAGRIPARLCRHSRLRGNDGIFEWQVFFGVGDYRGIARITAH